MEQLHPNLARLAAMYDDIFEQYTRGQVSAADAKARIRNLIARDDTGIEWAINPDDRNWYRRTVHGQWVQDRPPTMGVPTPSGWDISGGTDPMADPRYRVEDTNIDPRLATNTESLRGSTARLSRNMPAAPVPKRTERNRWLTAITLVAVTAVALLWFFTAWNSPVREDPVPNSPDPSMQMQSTTGDVTASQPPG